MTADCPPEKTTCSYHDCTVTTVMTAARFSESFPDHKSPSWSWVMHCHYHDHEGDLWVWERLKFGIVPSPQTTLVVIGNDSRGLGNDSHYHDHE